MASLPHLEWLEALGHKADFGFQYKGREILLELDGYDHFIADAEGYTTGYNGNTLLQSALMAKLKPDAVVVRLRFAEGNIILDANDPALLRGLMDMAVKAGPGVYETCRDDQDRILLKPHLPLPHFATAPLQTIRRAPV